MVGTPPDAFAPGGFAYPTDCFAIPSISAVFSTLRAKGGTLRFARPAD
jgi:hypothetical protein